jgi:hypothetical protein
MIEIIEEDDPPPQAQSPTPSRERKTGAQAQELPRENADMDSLAMSYLGRAQAEGTLEKPRAPHPAGLQRCPHCHQPMPAKSAATPAPIPLAKPSVVQAQPHLAPARPAVAPAKPPAKSPVAPTQRAPRPSELSGRQSSGVPLRPVGEPTMRCPYCRETILLAARKCKHCGEFLDDTLRCLSEPSGNNRRGGNSGRVATEGGGGFDSLQELWHRIGPVKLAVAFLVVAGLAVVGIHFLGSKTSNNSAAAATPLAKVEASMGEDKVSAAKDTLDKLTNKLEKQLEGTSVRSAAGSTLSFENSDKGVMPWGCELSGAGKTLKGLVTVPFKIESSERGIVSSRGRYVLDFAFKDGAQWELQSVTKETRILIKDGAESPIPDEDRPSVRQKDNDFAVVCFKKTLSKLAPAPAND